MDSQGNIYPISDLSIDQLDSVEVKEDVARLDGFLRGRAEAVKLAKPSGARMYETLVHDSSKGAYRKENPMGIEGIETLAGHSDPGDEQQRDPVPAAPIEDPAQTDPPKYPADETDSEEKEE